MDGAESFECSAPMQVMKWSTFCSLKQLLRSDQAADLLHLFDADQQQCIFVSHHWWTRPGMVGAPPHGAADFVEGERAHLKLAVICKGVTALIEREALDPERVVLWIDWFSIDQVDPVQKRKGIESMLYYVTSAQYMLVPLHTPAAQKDTAECEDNWVFYPEDIAEYGSRGWCRVEYFIFAIYSQMAQAKYCDDGVALFACGTAGELQQFRTVEFLGGERGDMPSQGAFTIEADRAAIIDLEDSLISSYGHQAIRLAVDEDAKFVDLGAQMLRDEHWPTLEALMDSGALVGAHSLSFNSNPLITTLPRIRNMPNLHTISLINCIALQSLPDLSQLESLELVKLEQCNQLAALPALPSTIDREMMQMCLPAHLCLPGHLQ